MPTKIIDEGEHHNFLDSSSSTGPSTATHEKVCECSFERKIHSNRGVIK